MSRTKKEAYRRFRPQLECLENRDCPAPLPMPAAQPYVEIVKDLNPGAASSSPFDLTAVDAANPKQSHLYFFAMGVDNNNNDVIDLWISNGTAATTTLVKSFAVGAATDTGVSAVAFKGKFYFIFNDTAISDRLWVSDGTANGTTVVKDSAGNDVTNPDGLFATPDWLYFSASDPAKANNRQLWRSDGTAGNTDLFWTFDPNGSSNPETMGLVNGKYLFVAADGVDPANGAAVGNEMFVLDLSAKPVAVELVKDIVVGAADSDPSGFAVVGNDVYFTAAIPAPAPKLSDRVLFTCSVAQRFVDIPASCKQVVDAGDDVGHLTATDRQVFWTGTDNMDFNLYERGGINAMGQPVGVVVKDKNGDAVSPADWPIGVIPASSSVVYNILTNAASQPSISDGTQNGTGMVNSIPFDALAPPDNSITSPWEAYLNTRNQQILFFRADTEQRDGQLFWSSGKIGGGAKVIAAKQGTYSKASNIVLFDGQVFFTATDANNGVELWIVRNADKIVTQGIQTTGDSYAVLPGQTLNVAASNGVLANDVDLDGTTMAASVVTQPEHGSLTLNSDGSFSYTPNSDFSGTDGFTYEAGDGTNTSDVTQVSLSVTAGPVANDDALSVYRNGSLVFYPSDLLANDVDASGGTLSIASIASPAHGSLTANSDGSFTYVPTAGYVGDDSFTYAVSDGTTESAAATVYISVTDPGPQGTNTGYQVPSNGSLSVNAVNGILATAIDDDSDNFTAVLVSGPANGSLTLNVDGSFSYTATPGFAGNDSFTFQVSDGSVLSDVYTVQLEVLAAAPTGVSANVISSTEIDIAFTLPTGAATADIYRSTSPTGSFTLIASGVTATTYQDTGLSADTQYYYYVAGVDSNGNEGASSAQVNGTTRVGAPTGVSASVVSSAEIDIAFTLPTGATTADIYRSTSPTGGFTLIASGVTSSPYHDTGLSAGTEYYYYVAGVDSNGNQGANSSQVDGTTLLSAPTGLTATAVSPTEINLSFNAAGGAGSYTIYTSTDGSTWTQLVSGLTSTSYSDSGLTTGTTYYFYVVAVDGSSREGDHSTTANTLCVPAAFTMELSGFGGSFTQLNGTWTLTPISPMQWRYSSGELSFDFGDDGTKFYASVTDYSYGDVAVWHAPLGSYNWVGAITTLTFIFNNFPDSTLSVSVSADNQANFPNAPTNLSTSVASSGGINIAFVLPAGAVSADIYRSTSPSSGFTLIAGGVTSSNYQDTSLSAGTQYFYQIAGVDSNGNEGAASQVSGTTLLAAPTGLTASVASSSEIDLSFGAVSGASSYTIYTSTDGSTWTQLVSGLTSTSYSDTGLASGTTYYFYVVAVDGSSREGDHSSAASAHCGDSGQNNPSITYPAPNQDVTSQLYDLWIYGAYGATPYNIVSVTIDGTISASQIDNDISNNFWDAEFPSLTAPPTPTYHTLLVVDTNGGETSTTIWY